MTLKLSTSDSAFKYNIKKEYNTDKRKGVSKGKKIKRAVAIAYSEKREAAKKGK